MSIDWSTRSSGWWKESFEKYISTANGLGHLAEDGLEGTLKERSDIIKSYFESFLPTDTYGEKTIEVVEDGWIVNGTHPKCGPFRIQNINGQFGMEWTD